MSAHWSTTQPSALTTGDFLTLSSYWPATLDPISAASAGVPCSLATSLTGGPTAWLLVLVSPPSRILIG